jgi:hypothetical protein
VTVYFTCRTILGNFWSSEKKAGFSNLLEIGKFQELLINRIYYRGYTGSKPEINFSELS